MKRLVKFGVGTASLFIAAQSAMAAPPAAYGSFNVTAGAVTSTLVGGTSLEATGTNILQEKVNVGGTDYFHTVVVGVGSNGDTPVANLAAITAVGTGSGGAMINESYVPTSSGNDSVAVRSSTYFGATITGNSDNGSVISDVNAGVFDTGTATVAIDQINFTGNAARASRLNLAINGEAGSETGRSLNLDVTDAGNHGQLTLRQREGDYVASAGTLTGPLGGTVTYSAGDALEVVYIQDMASGQGPNFALPNTVGSYTVNDTALDRAVGIVNLVNDTTGDSISEVNDSGTGVFQAANKAALVAIASATPATGGTVFGTTTPINIFTGSTTAVGDLWWDSAMFGTAPNHYVATPNSVASATSAGVNLVIGGAAPAGTPTTNFFPFP